MKKTVQSFKAKLRAPTRSTAGTPSRPILNDFLRAAEISIRLLKELSDTVPFIGSAASGTIFIIEQCKKYVRNSKDFDDLLRSLQTLESLVSPYKDGKSALPSKVMESIQQFNSVISDIQEDIKAIELTGRVSQLVNSNENERKVADALQKAKEAMDRIMLASLLEVSPLAQSLLSLNPVHSARYNCIDRDRCLNGTRVTVLDDIEKWFDTGEEQVYWLNGAAGMGKTTIALSVAHRLSLNNQRSLMATFFCSRDSVDRKNPGLIFPTLACQLASWNRDFQDALVDALDRYPYIGQALPYEQVQRLIVEPLHCIKPSTHVALVVDALDECDGERASEKILLALLQHIHSAPSLKVFVSCRPAAYVEALLSSGEHRRMFKLHHVPASIVNSDLRLFYHQRLEEIRSVKKLDDWPPGETIEKLVQQAAGLFIYAVTVCKYINSPGDARRRLEYIANIPKTDYNDALSVDMLYTEVLSAALEKITDDHDRRNFARLLATVMHVQVPLTVDSLGYLLDIEPEVIYDLLRDIHSILSVPDDSGTFAGEMVHAFHASFPDYMTARMRVGEKHLELGFSCLQCMNRELKRILPFSERHLANHEILGLQLLIETHISSTLRYAVLYWADHLPSKDIQIQDHPIFAELKVFASSKLLFWLECLSLLDASESAIRALVKGKDWLTAFINQSSLEIQSTAELLTDTYYAVNEFFPIVQDFGVHLYLSFLLFLPRKTSLYRHYSHHLPPSWEVTGGIRKSWNPLICSTHILSFSDIIAFSPDERSIVNVGCNVGALDILSLRNFSITKFIHAQEKWQEWETRAIPGLNAAFPAGGDNNLQPGMNSVVWLPSGVIATCCTILSAIQKPYKSHCYLSLWDSETGNHIRLLFKHLGLSTPSSLSIWNTENWDQICSCASSTLFYRSFALSDDHYFIGREVRVTSNNFTLSTLNINPQSVASSVFSYNGDMLVLGSTSGLIEAWTVFPESTRVNIHQFLPQDPVALPSIASAHELIAISFDNEVYLFTLVNNCFSLKAIRRIAYGGRLRCITLSPSGRYVACHDEGGGTYVWSTSADISDSSTRRRSQSFDHWYGPLSCVAYMADSRFCLSGITSGTLLLWNCDTGATILTWKTQGLIESVAASPDGRFIASSGPTGTQIWSLAQVDRPKITITIPGPRISLRYYHINGVTFSSDSTMLAIMIGPVIFVWKFTEASGWRRYTEINIFTEVEHVAQEDLHPDSFVSDDSFVISAEKFDYRWLLHHHHNVQTIYPFPNEEITVAEDKESLLQCRSAFKWNKVSKPQEGWKPPISHFQLYISLDNEYILTPSGIYTISNGEQMASYRDVLTFNVELETKDFKFWEHEKEHYKRGGVLKTLHPGVPVHLPSSENENAGWIVDSDGKRAFWLPNNLFRSGWPLAEGYSCASAEDRFAFITQDSDPKPVFVHVPGVSASSTST
ncbi:hypothetical protein BDP27DRAFT_1319502 [Rhodocollybia butyracea]|uniref:Nephrocystin 3-like N-terminal domain-containing protein n=1 Tax=Rhodocollybia butyracea TaxID=206335 RepID=A0A9P5PZN0_9AGAR|nr:hypothetical protein BDP27DRAFT_1319502 [Rhodocollybia butyracea]